MNAHSLNGQVRSALTSLLALVCISQFSAQAGEQPRTLQTFGVQVKRGQPVYPLPDNVALGLFNPDPLLDLAYYADGNVQVWQNLGNGTFGSEPVWERWSNGVVEEMQWRKNASISKYVYDSHSWGDLLIKYADGSEGRITHQQMLSEKIPFDAIEVQSTPPFNFREVWRSPLNSNPQRWFFVDDIDNDGRTEVVYFLFDISPTTQGRIVVYKEVGNNQYVVDWDTLVQRDDFGPLGISDVDQDGHKEIVMVYNGGGFGVIGFLECYGPRQYRFYRSNIGFQKPLVTTAESDINHNGIKELCVLTSDPSVTYDQTFIYIAEFVGKGPGPSGWSMAFNQTIARISQPVYDMAIGQIDGGGWDEIVLGTGGSVEPRGYAAYLKYSGTPGVFAWQPHFIEAGQPANCLTPQFVDLDGDSVLDLLMAGGGPIGYGSVYGLKHIADTTYSVMWVDSTFRAAPVSIAFGSINGIRTVIANNFKTEGPTPIYSAIEILQDGGNGVYSRVGNIPLLQDSAVYLRLSLTDPDSDGRADIIGARTRETHPVFDNRLVDLEGDSSTTGIRERSALSKQSRLFQNSPNPFNPTTIIAFRIENSGYTALKVFDMLGREVAAPMNEELSAGDYKVTFNGKHLASGIYFYRLRTKDFIETRKMLLVR